MLKLDIVPGFYLSDTTSAHVRQPVICFPFFCFLSVLLSFKIRAFKWRLLCIQKPRAQVPWPAFNEQAWLSICKCVFSLTLCTAVCWEAQGQLMGLQAASASVDNVVMCLILLKATGSEHVTITILPYACDLAQFRFYFLRFTLWFKHAMLNYCRNRTGHCVV